MDDFLKLSKSSIRGKVLLYFFTNPEAEHYLRELAALLRLDAGNLSKELSSLKKKGVFLSRKRGNQKLFAINKTFPLYNELKSIVHKTIGIEGRLKAIVASLKGIECAFIFGSFAANSQTQESDIDVFIIGNPDEDKLISLIEEFEKSIGREINYNIFPLAELKDKIKAKDSFISNILKGKKIILKGNISGI